MEESPVRRLLLLGLLLGLLPPSSPYAEDQTDDIVLTQRGFSTLDGVIYGGDFDIEVATIVAVRDSGATQANPPLVTIDLHEMLRGSRPRGIMTIRWMPTPLYMPCAVGEGGTIRRWEQTPMRGPAVGSKMILGGEWDWRTGMWGCSVFCRWKYSDSLRDKVRQNVRLWKPRVDARLRAAAAARLRRQQDEKARVERAEAQLRDRENSWQARWREVARRADIGQLVRSSSVVVVGQLASRPADFGWQPAFSVESWLRSWGQSSSRDSSIRLFLGTREDSLIRRWSKPPPDDVVGSRPGSPLRWVAFLDIAHDSVPDLPWVAYRPVDGNAGLLLVDSRTLLRVRDEIQRWASQPPDPELGRSAELAEFVGLDVEQAAQVGIKVTSMPTKNDSKAFELMSSLVLGCTLERDSVVTSVNTSSFRHCALPNDRYVQDFNGGGRDLFVPPEQMEAVLDSLGTIPALRTKQARSEDMLTLTVQQVRGGRERVYESTLDSATFLAVVRVLAAVFTVPQLDHTKGMRRGLAAESRRINMWYWTRAYDRRCDDLWNPPRLSSRR
jgi:hypothetical protein